MKFKLIALAVLSVAVTILYAQSPLTTYCSPPSGIVEVVAPWYCSHINLAVAANWSAWEPVAIASITVSFLIAVIIFMSGIAFKNERLRTYGVAEMYEALATALIVLMFLFIAAIMFGLLPGLTAGSLDPFDASLTYMAHTLNATSNLATSLFITTSTAKYYASFSLSTCTPLECENALGIFTAVMDYIFFYPGFGIMVFLFDGLFSVYVQYYLVLFMLYAAIPAFLIPGVIFRAFIPTRHVGGMLMAIAIGFYFIMPILFSIAYYFTSPVSSTLAASTAVINRYNGNTQQIVTDAINPGSPLVSQLTNVQTTFGTFWLSILFFPTLIVALTYAFIIQIAEFIGGMARTSSRLRSLV
ncbi:MAG: hypothetical protein KGH72_01795 [Candidatus Micrarchaeota archaeon]|nr:hypothetical protein [Candidatus Micrarchaeota archaeon]